MFKIALLALFIVDVMGTPEYHHFVQVSENGAETPQDIVYDADDETVLITIGPIPQSECGVPTINFHDFRTGYVAYKDVNASICYLARPPISHPTPDLYRMKKSKITLYSEAIVSDEIMSPQLVKEVAGVRIYQFCTDYDTYWMHIRNIGRAKREASDDCIKCNGCVIIKL